MVEEIAELTGLGPDIRGRSGSFRASSQHNWSGHNVAVKRIATYYSFLSFCCKFQVCASKKRQNIIRSDTTEKAPPSKRHKY